MHSISNDDATLYGDKLEHADRVELGETIIHANCRVGPHGYVEGSILSEGDSRKWVIRLSPIASNDPLLELPQSARPLDIVSRQAGHTLVSATPLDVYGDSPDDDLKQLLPLTGGLRGSIDVPDNATILISE